MYSCLFLASTCTNGKKYYDCGSACPKTCDNIMASGAVCTQACVDGCSCPPDLFWDPRLNTCLPRSQCSCYREGVSYAHGSVRSGKCEDW